MAADEFRHCIICPGPLVRIPCFLEESPVVTSDCRPWPDGRCISACSQCGLVQSYSENPGEDQAHYANYAMYSHATPYSDQKLFGSGTAKGRTSVVLDHVRDMGIEGVGSILDVGCGNGAGMLSLAKAFPQAWVEGLEPYDKTPIEPDPSRRIRSVHRSWDGLEGTYELVTLFHVLEHMADPVGALARLRKHLTSNGHILVQVPYYPRNPFDLTIVDHAAHFRKIDLLRTIERSGLHVSYLTNEVISKELTALASMAPCKRTRIDSDGEGDEDIGPCLAWLERFARRVRESASECRKIGVYGAGPVGAWIQALIPDHVRFFIDDDPDRQGQKLNGCPILRKAAITSQDRIIMAFRPEAALQVALRERIAADLVMVT